MLTFLPTKFLMHFNHSIQILLDFYLILFRRGLKLGNFVIDYCIFFLELGLLVSSVWIMWGDVDII